MKIYFVRHGESELNIKEIHQSHSAVLSPKGRQQAQFVANRFKAISIDLIFSSDFSRALETANIIGSVIGKDIELNTLLREIKRPSEIEGKGIHEPEVLKIKELIKNNKHNKLWHHSDEENMYDLMKRSQLFIEKLKKMPEANVLVVSYGIIIRMIIARMMWPEVSLIHAYENFCHFMHMTNTGITVCERLDGNNFRLLTWNDYAHLGDLYGEYIS